MAIRRVIVIGDKTTHGGIVLQGSHSMSADGRNVSLEGDLVACPQCKGNFPIIEGTPLMTSNGRRVALEGMQTACGARLIASQNLMKADDGLGTANYIPASYQPISSLNSGEKNAFREAEPQEENQPQYTHYFILKDEQGKPLSGEIYIAKSKSTESKGTLDINGKTKVISTKSSPEELELFIEINRNGKKRERYITKAMSDIKEKNSFTEYTVPEEKAEIIFIGGAGDVDSYYRFGPTGITKSLQEAFFNTLPKNLSSRINKDLKPIGYNEAFGDRNIKKLEKKLIKSNLIYIIGHSLGGWNGAHLATILSNNGYTVKMLVTLDPVGTGVVVGTISDIYWKPEKNPKTEKWINVRAESDKLFDGSDIIANLGGQWHLISEPTVNEVVKFIHADAINIFTTKLSTGLSALDYVIQDLKENLL